MLVWLNGRWIAARAARVSALDRGLLHGDGVYDTWRTYGGRPFATADHVSRLAAAARILELPPPGPAAAWEHRVRALVARNRLPDAAVRLTLTRGAAGDGVLPMRRGRPTLLLVARPLPPDLGRRQAEGITATLLPFPRDAAPLWGSLKLLGHASAVRGRLLAARRGADEGLYVNGSGEVTEGTTTNLFLVEHGRLLTPPLAAGVLPGVTRALVLRLARRAGLMVGQESLTVARLRAASEVFVTASTVELLPVVALAGRRVGGGRPGSVTRLLQARYAAHVAARVAGPR